MKNIKEFIFKSVLFSFILSIFLLGTYFVIQARSNTKTTTDTEPNALYVSNNETLSAAKRNSMAEKVLGLNNVKTKVITGTTAAADSTTVAHGLNWDNIINVECFIRYTGRGPTYFVNAGYLAGASFTNRMVLYDGTNIILNHAGDAALRSELFRCIVFYN